MNPFLRVSWWRWTATWFSLGIVVDGFTDQDPGTAIDVTWGVIALALIVLSITRSVWLRMLRKREA